MDSELTELDDWVGTLEELQLGLERKRTLTPSNFLPSSSSPSSKSSYSGPHHLMRSPAVPPSPRRVAQILTTPPALPPRSNSNVLSPPLPPSLSVPGKDVSSSTAKTLTQSIRASFNSLSYREATAENDLDCLLRQLEEVENTMKQLEQDNGEFTRRYSLVSSSTTDPNTSCNPSPAPDASIPLTPLATNGNAQGSTAEEQSASSVETKLVLSPMLLPSSSATDYEVADEVSPPIVPSPTARIIHVIPQVGSLIGDASPEGVKRHHSMKLTVPSSQTSGSGILLSTDIKPPITPPPASPLGPIHRNACIRNNNSISDKPISEIEELSKKLSQVVNLVDRLQLNKLVVRIFRPDKTTKAVLIDQSMTAGEVASMLIEKNFLEPSIKLCLVEKVPSLKVERIFEESETVAQCILEWPIKSQNMIFFESREDHFGFIESPKDWLGETYANVHGFHSNDSVQTMLENFACSGLAEWRDFLYIRKPGEKDWTRRMCVLRNSGLYATKKSKKAFTASDLVRLLGLDGKLHIYTTTGGWRRMKAPTPHGFALKTYAAQDFGLSHVFCFCASDENALKQWACRLRLAKFGINLLRDYRTAKERVSAHLNNQPQKLLTRQSPVDFTGLPPLSTQLPRRQEPDRNLFLTRASPPPPRHPSAKQHTGCLTPQPTTVNRRPVYPPPHNGYMKHHSNGVPPENSSVH